MTRKPGHPDSAIRIFGGPGKNPQYRIGLCSPGVVLTGPQSSLTEFSQASGVCRELPNGSNEAFCISGPHPDSATRTKDKIRRITFRRNEQDWLRHGHGFEDLGRNGRFQSRHLPEANERDIA